MLLFLFVGLISALGFWAQVVALYGNITTILGLFPFAWVLLAIGMFIVAILMLETSNLDVRKKPKSRKRPLKLPDDYFKDHESLLEENQRHLWSCCITNGQNHVAYQLTVIVAIFALIIGWDKFSTHLILTATFCVLFVALLLLDGWLLLRSYYWTIWADRVLLLTDKDIVKLFNKQNKDFKNNLPSYSAILTLAVKKNLDDLQKSLKWSPRKAIRKLALMTGS